MKGHCFLPRPRSRRLPHQAWAPFLLLGVPPRPAAYMHGQLRGRGGQQGPSFVYHPCLSLTRRERSCCFNGCCLEKSKRRRGKGEKSPDQGAVVTMTTVSAPVALRLGEGVGLWHPSVPPTLLPPSHLKPTTLSSALWKKPLAQRAAALCMALCQLLCNWRAARKR